MYKIENLVACVLYVMYTQYNFVIIRNWLRNRNTLELLGIWEQLHNIGFNSVEFDWI